MPRGVISEYISNKELYYESMVSKSIGELTPKCQAMFLLLGERVITKFSYPTEGIKHDCLYTGYECLFDMKKWGNFNHDIYDNAFAYYTEIFKRGIAQGWNTRVRFIKTASPVHVISLNDGGPDGQGIHNI